MSLLRRIGQDKPNPDPKDSGAGSSDPGKAKLDELRLRRQAVGPAKDTTADLKNQIQTRLIAELDPRMDLSKHDEVRHVIREMFDGLLQQENMVLTRQQRSTLFDQIIAEILGLGPLQPLLEDDDISEIMVNAPDRVYVEKKGRLHLTDVRFESNEHVNRIIDRIVSPIGRRVDESTPFVDARLLDGSRVNIVIPPLALKGSTITIRKFFKDRLQASDLIRFGSVTPEGMEFLKACVEARLNVVVSGGTGSGKTTLLNVMSSFIPSDERIVTVENAAELQLDQDHVVTLESRPPNIEGRGEVSIQQLVINCLRMRPDRIIVGEIRGGEALDMLQAMNTGHDGSLTTAHSNGPRDTISRLETMSLMAGMDLPLRAIREQISSAVDLCVHQERFRDGSRRIVAITEVQGMEGDVITLADIFAFQQTGMEDGKVLGRLRPTGIRPKFMDRIEAAGIHLPPNIFGTRKS
ncbi:MAG: CpaF family protein [Ardenticatenales bacterium]|nr:CpaF family protein [Ardenticatenales bacterium]